MNSNIEKCLEPVG